MRKWPTTIPHDLAQALAELDKRRSTPTDSDRWGVVFDWLERHGIQAPDHPLPMTPEVRGRLDQ